MIESNLLEQLYKWKDIVVGIDYGQGGDKAVKVIALYHPNGNFEVLAIEEINKDTISSEEDSVIWQLPVIQSNLTDHDWLHPKAKYHAFINDISACGKFSQDTNCFETTIDANILLQRKELACKKCMKALDIEF